MDDLLAAKLQELKSSLEKDERVIHLNELDSKLNQNEEVMKLSYQKEMALINFEDALKHFGENSEEVKIAQRKLYEAKLLLDSHPLVKEYNLAYKEVRDLYNKINKELFKDFDSKNSGDFSC